MDISNLDKENLEIALRGLKQYKKLKKELGGRAQDIFNKQRTGENTFKVEYSKTLTKEKVLEGAQKVYSDSFGVKPTDEEIILKLNEDMLGGMRVFFNDYMVDLSADTILKNLK